MYHLYVHGLRGNHMTAESHQTAQTTRQILSVMEPGQMKSNAQQLPTTDESADARRIITAVPQSDWKRPTRRPQSSHLLADHNEERSIILQPQRTPPNRPLWRLMAI